MNSSHPYKAIVAVAENGVIGRGGISHGGFPVTLSGLRR